jgi:hypothetical protein
VLLRHCIHQLIMLPLLQPLNYTLRIISKHVSSNTSNLPHAISATIPISPLQHIAEYINENTAHSFKSHIPQYSSAPSASSPKHPTPPTSIVPFAQTEQLSPASCSPLVTAAAPYPQSQPLRQPGTSRPEHSSIRLPGCLVSQLRGGRVRCGRCSRRQSLCWGRGRGLCL